MVRLSHPPSHVTYWSCEHVILKKSFVSTSRGELPPILARCELSWVEHNHRVTWLIYHVIKIYSQKGATPVSQREWVRVQGLHTLFQVTCWSSDHVFFGKRHVSTNVRPQNSAADIKHRKTHKWKAFLLFKIH